MSEKDHKDIRFWVGFFIGGLLGAIVLFFLGTKEGKRTGKDLHDKGGDILDEISERLNAFVEESKELVKEGNEMKEEVVERLGDTKQKITESTTDSIESALAHIEALQERGRQTTASLRKKFKNLPKK